MGEMGDVIMVRRPWVRLLVGRGVHNNKQTAGTVKFKLDNGELSLAIILYSTSTHRLRPPLTSQHKVGQFHDKYDFSKGTFYSSWFSRDRTTNSKDRTKDPIV